MQEANRGQAKAEGRGVSQTRGEMKRSMQGANKRQAKTKGRWQPRQEGSEGNHALTSRGQAKADGKQRAEGRQ